MRFRIYGDCGILVEFGDKIDPDTNGKVRAATSALQRNTPPGVTEVVPAYRSLLVAYDPRLTSVAELKESLIRLENEAAAEEASPPKTVEVPVCYGGEYGPDIEFVAKFHGIAVEKVVASHSSPEYLVYMLGFTPGFPFLGGLPENLRTPRLEKPRTRVPAGSVGIANDQTGVYPIESPGGWRLIGRTPLKLFDPDKDEPFLLKAGAFLKFRPISPDEFEEMSEGTHP